MIASIFSKSKPINFIIVALFVTMLFASVNFKLVSQEFTASLALSTFSKYLVVLFLLFVLDFIISKNFLTQKNGYALMTFGLMFFVFPETLEDINIILASLFILFAMRRLISLHSKLNIKKKLFDAAFWIGVASIFYFWAIIFFIVVLIALVYFFQNDIKNVVVPFIGLLVLEILYVCYNIVFNDSYFGEKGYLETINFDYSVYNSKSMILALTIILSIFIWILIYYFKTIQDKSKKLRPSYLIIAWFGILALLLVVITNNKNGSEFIFLFAPFSLVMANYLELVSEKWFKEAIISLLLLVPIVNLFL